MSVRNNIRPDGTHGLPGETTRGMGLTWPKSRKLDETVGFHTAYFDVTKHANITKMSSEFGHIVGNPDLVQTRNFEP